jgi:hypothetical protein
MSEEIRKIWPKFDDLAGQAANPDTKLIIEALKLQAELMNLRLAGIEQATIFAAKTGKP